MSFYSFRDRDRPRLSERLRGKSGDELFNELRKELDQDRKLFFDSPSSTPSSNIGSTGSSIPRAGHLFEEPLIGGHTDIRSHLENLAQRHPEFADQLRYPAWSSDKPNNTWGRKRHYDAADTSQQEPPKPEAEPTRGRPKDNLRNTFPDMGQKQQQDTEDKESRGQRSWSAPPDNREQPATDKPRFVSKIEIQPVNPDAAPQTGSGDATKPPMAPTKPQPQQQQPQTQQQPKQSNVRHIPIFVEGRDEPILPKNIEPEFTQSHAPPPQQFSRPQTHAHTTPTQSHFQQQHHQNHEPSQQQKPQQAHDPPPQKPKQQPPMNPRDPLFRVEAVQKDVDELKDRVEKFSGNSRTDKEFILLDELLTRNLIKLDDIETEGKEEVRTARKNTIKCIQRCISVLENKVPALSGDKKEENMEIDQEMAEKLRDTVKDPTEQSAESTPMDQSAPVDSSAENKIEQQMQQNDKKPEEQQQQTNLSTPVVAEAVQESNPLSQPLAEEVETGDHSKDKTSNETLEEKKV